MGSSKDEFSEGAGPPFLLVASIIFTTVQMQGIAGHNGDRAHNRRILPLVIGDKLAFWSIAVV